MRKIAITPPDIYQGENMAIMQAIDEGFDLVHIRKPTAKVTEVAQLLEKISPHYLSRIVLHDCFELAARYPIHGIHLNKRSCHIPKGFNGSISRSCHTLDEVCQYKDECSYLFLSPIFDSISKNEYQSRFSIEDLRKARMEGIIDNKVYALGGITNDRIAEVETLGFGGVAMLGSVWGKLTTPPVVLTIAGSDSSGGAGIQADIKTISALGGYAASVITALTAQNTQGVTLIEPVSQQMLKKQMEAVFDDLEVAAVKIGMVYDATSAHIVAETLRRYRPKTIVCDPVMISTSGSLLMQEETIEVVEKELFPQSNLITPNLHEASMLARCKIKHIKDMYDTASNLSEKYGCGVLIKGGHLDGNTMCDVLYDGESFHEFVSRKIDSRNLHGTGCTLSSAIATRIAHGDTMQSSIESAKRYVTEAIGAASPMNIGKGNGPLWHFF